VRWFEVTMAFETARGVLDPRARIGHGNRVETLTSAESRFLDCRFALSPSSRFGATRRLPGIVILFARVARRGCLTE
jgi:hypothetical protein